ncbi:hypothetical protein P171DRAFT_182366 [Karstenula rhodostoma CBS 690.94]|uniref:Uncharacterized protein n=1 Tax=Karstenula rhodostoma CBS 690.94 TaxID=1392251 RepID=A0A9P4P6J2_9PLEO|nr:hypothetical protein P171DRAFT_182366 [Karstenula rhodostoma CBS 690.94]
MYAWIGMEEKDYWKRGFWRWLQCLDKLLCLDNSLSALLHEEQCGTRHLAYDGGFASNFLSRSVLFSSFLLLLLLLHQQKHHAKITAAPSLQPSTPHLYQRNT